MQYEGVIWLFRIMAFKSTKTWFCISTFLLFSIFKHLLFPMSGVAHISTQTLKVVGLSPEPEGLLSVRLNHFYELVDTAGEINVSHGSNNLFSYC